MAILPPAAARKTGFLGGTGGLLGGSLPVRLLLGALVFLPVAFFFITLPEIAIARNNPGAPRPLDWAAVTGDRADLVHSYVRAEGYLTPSILRMKRVKDGLTGHSETITNTYELLIDPRTHTDLVVTHHGGNSQPVKGRFARTTVTGILVPLESKVRDKLSTSRYRHVNRSYQLVSGRTPGNLGGWIAIGAGEVVAFLALAGLGVVVLIRSRQQTNTVPVVGAGAIADDWKKFRMDG